MNVAAGARPSPSLGVSILDRYMIAELGGPFAFGLSAFTLIFAATQLLAISRLVAAEHAPIGPAIAYFLWQLPGIVVLVVPMAMLLGTLLALGRLSGESELVAMKAGGISLVRAVAPLLVSGLIVSLAALWLGEVIVPIANDRAATIRDNVIEHANPLASGNLTIASTSPAGGRQLTSATAFDASSDTLENVTVVQYDRTNRPIGFVFSERAKYEPPNWTFYDATEYRFGAGGDVTTETVPYERIDIGENAGQITKRIAQNNPEEMSRRQIREVLTSASLTPAEARSYEVSYDEKLARPFAAFVFTLIAIPFALRPPRGGGGAGLGFGLSILIAFVYFVIMSILSALATSIPGGRAIPVVAAWLPNVIFTAIGAWLVQRAARA